MQKVVIGAAVELAKGLKLLRTIHLDKVVKLFMVDVINVTVCLVMCQKPSIILFFPLLFLCGSAQRLGYLNDAISLLR